MTKKTASIIFFLIALKVSAQFEASNWYFGINAGVNFNPNTGTVTAINEGNLNTKEGCSSISDKNGALLFYTDGSIVYSKDHSIMLNGTGLVGDFSSTQSAIIVPKPEDENIFYIFTVDDRKTANNPINLGLNYSEVDMTRNGGLGEVTIKNVNLVPECSEKVTAVLKDCITGSFWVVTFGPQSGSSSPFNTFYAFEINTSGVSTTPVTSLFSSLNITDGRGYLKLSPDGKKMACASVDDGLFLYDFDTLTGTVSNQVLVNASLPNKQPYGLEFSPNSQLLYVNYSNDYFQSDSDIHSNHKSILAQYNLNAADITNSEVIIDNRQLYRGGLQLGPNGKIYRALSATYDEGLPYLGAINKPDIVGTGCNYQHNAVNLSPNVSTQGLPPFISSFFNTQIDIIKNGRSSTTLILCEGETYTLTAEQVEEASYLWRKDDVILTETGYTLEVSESGLYELYIEPNNGDCAIEGLAFVSFTENPVAYNHTLLQCDEDGIADNRTQFNLNEANSGLTGGVENLKTLFYLDASRNNSINGNNYTNISNPQTIYVEVLNEATGCSAYSELTIQVSTTQANNAALPPVCDDDGNEDGLYTFNLSEANSSVLEGLSGNLTISYFETYNDALLEVNELPDAYKNTTPYHQTIYSRVENDNNCYGISEVELIVNSLPNIETEASTNYCLNFYPETITINAGALEGTSNDYEYLWSNGAETFEIAVNEAGAYTVLVINYNGCSRERTITVNASNIATIENIEVKDASKNNTVSVIASGEGLYQYSLLDNNNNVVYPNQDNPVFENVKPGFYSVNVIDVKNGCGSVNAEISVIGFPKYFTPNNDGINDTWQVYGVSKMFQPNTKILIFNRFGKLIKELSPIGEGWNGTLNGKPLPSDDYWFSVKLQDGRVFKNHFTLKI